MSDFRHLSHSKSFQTNCRFADASHMPTLPLPLHESWRTPASPISPHEQPASCEAMFLGLAEEVSNAKDELDEEDKAMLTHAYA